MMSWEIPVHYGLLSKKMLDEQRMSSTMSSDSFARESMSIWVGNSDDSWINSDMIEKKRTLLHVERKNYAKYNQFYIIGVDVARYRVNTAITVIKCIPQEDSFKKNIVYLEIIQGKNFVTEQAPRIKELIKLYQPREVVIDGNGLGAGLMDAMVVETEDRYGNRQPAYYAFNDEAYLPPNKLTESEEPLNQYNAIIYNLKANASNDNDIHANFFSQLSSGHVYFLANERIAKDKLMGTKVGRSMTNYDKRLFLLPYEMTSLLINEISNLRLRPTGMTNKIQIEQISESTKKDRFSSLEYGLYRVKYYEDLWFRHTSKRNGGNFTFSSGSGGFGGGGNRERSHTPHRNRNRRRR